MATYATLPYPTTDLTVSAGLYNDTGQIWNGTSYVALSTLADIATWRALLIAAPELELSDATGAATYQTADIADAIAADQSCVVVFYSGAEPAPADAIAQQDMGADATMLLDLVDAIDGKTPREALQYIAAAASGKLRGAGTGEEIMKGLDGETDRLKSTVDADGNRSAVEYDPP